MDSLMPFLDKYFCRTMSESCQKRSVCPWANFVKGYLHKKVENVLIVFEVNIYQELTEQLNLVPQELGSEQLNKTGKICTWVKHNLMFIYTLTSSRVTPKFELLSQS